MIIHASEVGVACVALRRPRLRCFLGGEALSRGDGVGSGGAAELRGDAVELALAHAELVERVDDEELLAEAKAHGAADRRALPRVSEERLVRGVGGGVPREDAHERVAERHERCALVRVRERRGLGPVRGGRRRRLRQLRALRQSHAHRAQQTQAHARGAHSEGRRPALRTRDRAQRRVALRILLVLVGEGEAEEVVGVGRRREPRRAEPREHFRVREAPAPTPQLLPRLVCSTHAHEHRRRRRRRLIAAVASGGAGCVCFVAVRTGAGGVRH
mmetsp:Transcript_767/g.2780  ORF Transcript_767/g.2780 Transcript_767/m.2780 type:complete len:273 (+) Transcript_767:3-821(+)